MQAIILAAGMGTRIQAHFTLPKGFICLDEKPLIQLSIEKLKRVGIEKIIIVAGHLAHHYQALAKTDPALTVIINDKYNQYGSLYSLYCAKESIGDDCLILESDIFYELAALTSLINHNAPDTTLLSGATHSNDEVYVETHKTTLIDMSKDLSELNTKNILGEFVGITKLQFSSFQRLITLLDANKQLLHSGHYEEDGLVALSKQIPIDCLKVNDLLWCEVDNLQHLEAAKLIYKKRVIQ